MMFLFPSHRKQRLSFSSLPPVSAVSAHMKYVLVQYIQVQRPLEICTSIHVQVQRPSKIRTSAHVQVQNVQVLYVQAAHGEHMSVIGQGLKETTNHCIIEVFQAQIVSGASFTEVQNCLLHSLESQWWIRILTNRKLS